MLSTLLGGIVIGGFPIDSRNPVRVNGQGVSGYVSGRVLEVGVPVSRRVMCYHRKSGMLVGLAWSDQNGDYRIDNLIAGVTYYLTALDENEDKEQYNAVTQDLITASEVAQ